MYNIFDNLPLHITNDYNSNISHNLPSNPPLFPFFYMDINNLCDPKKIKKKEVPSDYYEKKQ